MNKFILALTLILLTPFFSSTEAVASPPQDKDCEKYIWQTDVETCGWTEQTAVGIYESEFKPDHYFNCGVVRVFFPSGNDPKNGGAVKIQCQIESLNYFNQKIIVDTGTFGITWTYDGPTTEPSCPNDDFPSATEAVLDDDGVVVSCIAPSDKECGDGYYKFKVFNNSGEGQCVPVDCDNEGSVKDVWASGGDYNNNAGTYCDGSCAGSAAGGQNDNGYAGTIAIRVVSTGSACGNGSLDDRWFDEGNGDECQTTTSESGGSFLKCPVGDGGGESPETPDSKIDLGENKLTENDAPLLVPVVEACAEGDPSCEIRNLKESIITQETEKKDLAITAHNKAVDAQQTSTNAIVDSINGLREANISAAEKALKGGGENGDGATTGGGGDGDEGDCSSEEGCSFTVGLKQEPSEGLEGFWKTEYEDGLEGIVNEKLEEVKSSDFYSFLETFNPPISGGGSPNMQMCFDLGAMGNFGCQEIKVDPRVYPAIRIFILITAGFLCRKILFGG